MVFLSFFDQKGGLHSSLFFFSMAFEDLWSCCILKYSPALTQVSSLISTCLVWFFFLINKQSYEESCMLTRWVNIFFAVFARSLGCLMFSHFSFEVDRSMSQSNATCSVGLSSKTKGPVCFAHHAWTFLGKVVSRSVTRKPKYVNNFLVSFTCFFDPECSLKWEKKIFFFFFFFYSSLASWELKFKKNPEVVTNFKPTFTIFLGSVDFFVC